MKDKLDLIQIHEHWKNWAITYGTELRATTKTGTAKLIELAELAKTISSLKESLPINSRILEIGCGNGHNLFSLHEIFPEYQYEGVDFIDEMISSAEQLRESKLIDNESICFSVGNVLNLEGLSEQYDLIFTVRCLINLNTDMLQMKAIANIAEKVKSGGYILMLENSTGSYSRQNYLRTLVGLEKREPAEFNHFMNEELVHDKLESLGFFQVKNSCFSTLHDIVLYVLLPMINGGKVDYDNPIVEAAAKLSSALTEDGSEMLGNYGQNRLYLYQKQ
ncbi:class I SAM-dependent methyltransferase [Aeromonas bestiarum]|uniref:class I SAM-dependent methyltransferase n=1 Tax=Aeromonas bestiarum TaxID=105751 RepID=UPI0032B2453E